MRPIYKATPSPVYTRFDWNGYYAGINAGYGWGRSRHDVGFAYGTSGVTLGGTAGINWQFGNYVVGGEADLDWSAIKGGARCVNPAFTCNTRNDWLGTARGRIGYAFGRWLPFVTAGGSVGNVRTTAVGPLTLTGIDTTRFGWAAGGGLEYAMWGNTSLKLDYLYVDLGSADCAAACGAPADRVKFSAGIVRGGVNYRF
jgi:outer membrane immunogenic protein